MDPPFSPSLQGLKHGVGHMMGGNRGRNEKWMMLGHTLRVGFRWDGMEGMNCSTVGMRVERKKVLYDWNGSIEKLSGRGQMSTLNI
jgi:hypothetical protein